MTALDLALAVLVKLALAPRGEVVSPGLALDAAYHLMGLGLAIVTFAEPQPRATITALGRRRVAGLRFYLRHVEEKYKPPSAALKELVQARLVEIVRGEPVVTSVGHRLLAMGRALHEEAVST